MRAAVFSDLHLEVYPYNYALPEADIAILAGDILVIERLARIQSRQTENTKPFLDNITTAYKTIYWIPGNHEYYYSDINTGCKQLRDLINDEYDNIHILDDDVCMLPTGHKLIGSTLWTDFSKEHPLVMKDARCWMTDYRVITNGKKRITPNLILERHKKSLEFLREEIACYDKNLVVTHHSPSFSSVAPRWREDDGSGLFHSDLNYLMGPNVTNWIHGHIHDRMSYEMNGTRVDANPRGYPGENPAYDPNFVLELE